MANQSSFKWLGYVLVVIVAFVLGLVVSPKSEAPLGGTSNVDTLGIEDGSASAPSLTFTSDSNTGLYRSGADAIDFTVGGARVAQFNGSSVFDVSTNTPTTTPGFYNRVSGTGTTTNSVGDISDGVSVGCDEFVNVQGNYVHTYYNGTTQVAEAGRCNPSD